MKLYEIEQQIHELLENGFNAECIDEETGEIDQEKVNNLLNGLQEQWDTKIENIGLYLKELDYDIAAMKEEEKNLAQRRKALENKATRLKEYVSMALRIAEKEKFETPRLKLSFRSSQSVELIEGKDVPSEFLKQKVVLDVDKALIKERLKEGELFDFAYLKDNKNLQIK